AIKIQRSRAASIEGVENRAVGNIKSVIRAGRADREASTHLRPDRYIWQETMVNSKWTVRQFVDPLRLEAFDENITRTEEFSGAQGYIIIEKIRDLGIYKIHIGAATARLDLQSTVE